MTLTLELPPEVEAELSSLAKSLGLDLSHYVEHLLRERASMAAVTLSPAERAALWRAKAEGLPPSAALSDAAISRENLYDVRG